MSWRDSLLPASYRGVAFHVDGAAGLRGRRYVRHEYPGRDEPFHEDLGRRGREETIEAFVLGADHVAKAKALIEACERAGQATLVHPYLGRLAVVCLECRPSWSTREGGMTRLSLTFGEPGQRRYPESQTAGSKKKTETMADKAMSAIGTALKLVANPSALPSYIGEAAAQVIGNAAGQIWSSLGGEVMSVVERSSLLRDISSLALTAGQAVFDPESLASRVGGLLSIDRWGGAIGDALLGSSGISWRAFLPLFSFDGSSTDGTPATRPMPLGATTVNRQREQVVVEAHAALVRKVALVQASRAAVAVAAEVVAGDPTRLTSAQQQDMETAEAAVAVRDTLTTHLRAAAKAALTDDEGRALTDLRIAVARVLTDAAPRLPHIAIVYPTRTEPAIVLAHRLYGDDDIAALADRAGEICTRNRVRHPMFVPGSRALRVLRDGTSS